MSALNISDKVSEIAKEDIQYLHNKIQEFNSGNVDSEKFRAFRLARGVYGQRQEGVQMIRIKLPYGKLTAKQLVRIADVSDKYAHHNLHATTRQDIQIHYVKLAESPMVWAELEEEGITLREACGNTVRNVTASYKAGIDPEEPFDVTPYAHAFFTYFLRNPICQEMGRKFKVAFSSSIKDSAYTFMHDLGFIPKIKDGVRGFEVRVGGGLGAQPMLAHLGYEFLPTDEIIPFAEAVIRVFDRYGERASRGKARIKFLIKNIGFEAFMNLVQEERTAVINKTYPIDADSYESASPASRTDFPAEQPSIPTKYQEWLDTNVFEQKQKGYYAVTIKLTLGDMSTDTARSLAQIVSEGYAADDIRVTVNQGYMLKFVRKEALPSLFNRLDQLGLADPGFDTTADITACPGTDTCNLGISSSTGAAKELERLIKEEFHELIYNNDIKIKISGCMNACGQHNIANIGFQGMTIKKGAYVMPAVQILLGGGVDVEGRSSIADKVVKIPSKRVSDAFRTLMHDYDDQSIEGEYFNNYYRRKLEEDAMYFFKLLKPHTLIDDVPEDFFVDWGTEAKFEMAVGVGECAGVMLDLVGTLIGEAEEKFSWGTKALEKGTWQDAIYHSYNTFVVGAKALLVGEGVTCNTQIGIIEDFDKTFVDTGLMSFGTSFKEHVLQLNKVEPSPEFSATYYQQAKDFIQHVRVAREAQIKRAETVS